MDQQKYKKRLEFKKKLYRVLGLTLTKDVLEEIEADIDRQEAIDILLQGGGGGGLVPAYTFIGSISQFGGFDPIVTAILSDIPYTITASRIAQGAYTLTVDNIPASYYMHLTITNTTLIDEEKKIIGRVTGTPEEIDIRTYRLNEGAYLPSDDIIQVGIIFKLELYSI